MKAWRTTGIAADAFMDQRRFAEARVHYRRLLEIAPPYLDPQLIAENELVLPIDSIFPIERTVEAYGRLEAGHVRGKIVIVTD